MAIVLSALLLSQDSSPCAALHFEEMHMLTERWFVVLYRSVERRLSGLHCDGEVLSIV
jgi:hypothetical protein